MLSERYSREWLAERLLLADDWWPVPVAAERAAWCGLSEDVRQEQVARAGEARSAAWPALTAALYLTYAREGVRMPFETPYFARRQILCDLALAESVDPRGEHIESIVNAIWSICEESTWVVPAHVWPQKRGVGLPDVDDPVVDLFAAETGATLAWVDHLLGPELDAVSPVVRTRIRREVHERILAPCLQRDDFWWMGFRPVDLINNWTPWICSNWLAAALCLEEAPSARIEHVARILSCLDVFLGRYAPDGGCDEGPAYWGHAAGALFDALDLLHHATAGALDVFGDEKIRNMGRYILRMHIDGSWFVNFADADARVAVNPSLVFRIGERIRDPSLRRLGQYFAAHPPVTRRRARSLYRDVAGIFLQERMRTQEPRAPYVRDAWLPGIQVMTARSAEGAAGGWFLAVKGGHNAESHNHNDVGQFIVYLDGRPVIVDAGVGEYTARTFSGDRYTIWTMQSAFHNLPTVDGVMQEPGRSYAARQVERAMDDRSASLSLDIAGAYPPHGPIETWRRTVALHRDEGVTIEEQFRFRRRPAEAWLTFMTASPPEALSDGALSLRPTRLAGGLPSGQAVLRYGPGRIECAVDPIDIDDDRLRAAWGDRLYRVRLIARRPPQAGRIQISLTRPRTG